MDLAILACNVDFSTGTEIDAIVFSSKALLDQLVLEVEKQAAQCFPLVQSSFSYMFLFIGLAASVFRPGVAFLNYNKCALTLLKIG